MKKKRMAAVIGVVLSCCLLFCIWYWFFGRPYRYYVTQYGDVTGLQGMFYIIESNRGDCIVIDGGNAGNFEYARQILLEKGKHIDAWILTHPHPDHIAVFNALWTEFEDRTEVVYVTDMNYDRYREKAREWDQFEVYEEFLSVTEGSDKIVPLHTGDELTICGLQMEVYHAYENCVDLLSGDLANDGSLLFKITNKQESFLFCSDVGNSMSAKIMEQYGDKLKCDYIQMGHHGNGGLSREFYELTKPKTAFFDAPEWLMNPGEGAYYTTPYNRELMENMGAEIYYYASAPNKIELK